ncbi:MAG: hypothetical protein JNG89_21160, partial [Planctomycetaceae bacterium]|nr:hypothetical protein [Planctomycetaceae bacterium]
MTASLTNPLAAKPVVADDGPPADSARRDVPAALRIAQVHSADAGGGAELTARLH